MEDSILTSTKKTLGVVASVDAFDLDIITHINASFSIVYQVGVTSTIISIEDDSATWSSLDLTQEVLSLLRVYIFLKVRSMFDPPQTSFLIEAVDKQIQEALYRLSYFVEAYESDDDPETTPGGPDHANGTQTTPLSIWIMTHNLGYTPAGWLFYNEDDEEIEPEELVHLTLYRTLAIWPAPIAGRWVTS